MRKIFILITVLAVVSGCASNQGFRKDDTLLDGVNATKVANATEAEKAALKFFNRGGFERATELFMEASGIYKEVGLKSREKGALVAVAKCQLWAGDRHGFLKTMTRVKELIEGYDYPDDDTLTLLNIADMMEERRLSYPVPAGQEQVFN